MSTSGQPTQSARASARRSAGARPDAADLRPRPGRSDARDAGPTDDQRAGIEEGKIFTARSSEGERAVPDALPHRYRLTAYERFVDRDVARLQKRGVGRDSIALAEHDQIVLHELSSRDPNAFAAADH
jgi:hypothetical protein